MAKLAAHSLMGLIHQNDDKLPRVGASTLDQAIQKFEQVEYSDFIVRAKEIKFVNDRLVLGKNEEYQMTSPFMDQVMKMTEMKKTQLEKLGEEKFIENVNFIMNDRSQTDYVLRTVNGVAYSILKQGQRRHNPINHKAFLNGIVDMVGNEFNDQGMWSITTDGHGLRVLTTHPTKHFDVGMGDIQREGLEFRNNDVNLKMSFHYHLLRTACTNSTIFPNYFAAERDSNDGPHGFDRFLRDSMRMFGEGKDIVPVYNQMQTTQLDPDVFGEVFDKLDKAARKDTEKILVPYLMADFVTNRIAFNEKKILERTEWDLFNDLTHYSKTCSPAVQQKAQAIAGEMVLDRMREMNPRMRARLN
jgi:hypothetical protein